MKRNDLVMLLAVSTAVFAFPGEPDASWSSSFQTSFYAALEHGSESGNPGKWLENREELFLRFERGGMDSGEAGRLAARLFLAWDLDLRSGISLQDANARARQSGAILSGSPAGEGRQEQRLLRSLRGREDFLTGTPPVSRGSIGGSSPGKGYGRR